MRSRFEADPPDRRVAPVALAAIPAGASLGWYADLRTTLLLLAAVFVPHSTADPDDVRSHRQAVRSPQTAGSHA
ncbi:hypothetical protein [Yimella lutea]|uniref:hypothetical protein n=1 Tax=Yimella lutea TaxID=587872 RepID=UPI00114F1CE7|nr:hypothetical protein [Yimella lutea]